MLEFTVEGQKLTRIDKKQIASHSVNYLYCHFTFLTQNEWVGGKSALFKNITTGESIISIIDDDNKCKVPTEVSDSDFCVMIYSTSGNVRITTTEVLIPNSINSFTDSASNATEATPSVMEQIISQYVENNVIINPSDTIVSYETTDIDFTTEL